MMRDGLRIKRGGGGAHWRSRLPQGSQGWSPRSRVASQLIATFILCHGGCGADIGPAVSPAVDSGTSTDAGAADAGAADAGAADAGAADAGAADAGAADAGAADAGAMDAGAVDVGLIDSSSLDSTAPDAGAVDVGVVDAGVVDADAVDAGAVDAGAVDAGAVDSFAVDAASFDAADVDKDAAQDGAASSGDATSSSEVLPPIAYKATPLIGAPVPTATQSKQGWSGVAPAQQPVFTVQTAAMGLNQPTWIDPCILPRDFDGDGDVDVVLIEQPDGPGKPRHLLLLRNNGKGVFTAEKKIIGGNVTISDCAAADLDNDGDLDLALVGSSGLSLYWNQKGTFTASTVALPAVTQARTSAVAVADFDNDGWLDIVTTPYIGPAPTYTPGMVPCICAKADPPYAKCTGGPCAPAHNKVVFLGNKQGKFQDLTPANLPLLKGDVWSLSVHDLDRDGWPDFFIGAEWGSHGWYRNEGGFAFTLHSADLGMRPWAHVMGSSVQDFDGDGHFDLFIADYGADTFYRGTAAGTFVNDSKAWNIWENTVTASAWGTVAADLDDDGRTDLVVGNEFVATPATFWGVADWKLYKQVPGAGHLIHHNQGTSFKSTWLPVANDGGDGAFNVVLGCADFDGDGDLDLLAATQQGVLQGWRNDTPNPGGVLVVRLVSATTNTEALGAWIQVWAGGHVQERYVSASRGKGGAGTYGHHFGLGAVKLIDKVVVRFPNGKVVTKAKIAAGTTLVVKQP